MPHKNTTQKIRRCKIKKPFRDCRMYIHKSTPNTLRNKKTDKPYIFSSNEEFRYALRQYVQNPDTYKKIYGPMSSWDTHKVTYTNYLGDIFNRNPSIWDHPDTDVSNWDVSNVENMKYMFCGCKGIHLCQRERQRMIHP